MAPKLTVYKYCEKCGEQVAFIHESMFPPFRTTIIVNHIQCRCEKPPGPQSVPRRFSPHEIDLIDNLPEDRCPHCRGSGRQYSAVCSPCAGTGLKPLGDEPQFTIFKYILPPSDEDITIETHALAEFIEVHMQGGSLCVWARVNKSLPKVLYRFRVYGTGWDMPTACGEYLGTAHGDGLVWHVFCLGILLPKKGWD